MQAAAMSARAQREGEAYLMEEVNKAAAKPRTPSLPRDADDHFDLAKWNRRRWL